MPSRRASRLLQTLVMRQATEMPRLRPRCCGAGAPHVPWPRGGRRVRCCGNGWKLQRRAPGCGPRRGSLPLPRSWSSAAARRRPALTNRCTLAPRGLTRAPTPHIVLCGRRITESVSPASRRIGRADAPFMSNLLQVRRRGQPARQVQTVVRRQPMAGGTSVPSTCGRCCATLRFSCGCGHGVTTARECDHSHAQALEPVPPNNRPGRGI